MVIDLGATPKTHLSVRGSLAVSILLNATVVEKAASFDSGRHISPLLPTVFCKHSFQTVLAGTCCMLACCSAFTHSSSQKPFYTQF